jgi:hypothetical protein
MSDEARRIGRGALWGLAATVIMAPFMAIGRLISARAPLFPELIAGHLIHRTHGALVAVVSVLGHLGYGMLAGALFAAFARPMTLVKGIGYGVLLWFIMQVIFLPWIGWSDFGLAHSPRGGFAFYTLLLHLVYGLALGQLGAHDEVTHHASFDELGHLRHVVV